jgi:predicted small secreted protein
MSRRTVAWLVVAVLVLLLGGLLVAACNSVEAAPDEYGEQVQALEVAWEQGAAARASLRLKGQRANASTCTEMYDATVASRFRWDDERFKARGQAYFVAGCLGRGKPGLSSAATTTTRATP